MSRRRNRPGVSSETPGSPFTKPGFIVSVGFIGLIAATGVILAVMNVTGPAPANPTPPATAPTATPTPEAAAESAGCGPDRVDLAGTLDTAPAAGWDYLGRVPVPVAEGTGPGRVDPDGYRGCFARTPDGALFAAVTLFAIGADPHLTRTHAAAMFADGPGRVESVAAAAAAADTALTASLQLAGFRLLRYDGSTAEFELAYQIGTAGLFSIPIEVHWSRGDWRFPATPDATISPWQIATLGGYIPWAAH